MLLTTPVLKSFATAKIFDDNDSKPINAIDFSGDGELLVTSGDDETVHLYDVANGKLRKTLNSHKYGVSHIRFTHSNTAVICASKTEFDYCLRYWSLHDNRYLRYFKGHRAPVVDLALSPKDDTFFSASSEGNIMYWDLRTDACQGMIHLKSQACVGFDSSGVCMGCCSEQDGVKLYDTRYMDRGPFLSFQFSEPVTAGATCLKFSSDGSHILVCGNKPSLHLVDAFQGQLRTFNIPSARRIQEASFSPDSNFVIAGGDNGKVYAWSTSPTATIQSEMNIGVASKGHSSPITAIKWHPTRMMFASASEMLIWWVPTMKDMI